MFPVYQYLTQITLIIPFYANNKNIFGRFQSGWIDFYSVGRLLSKQASNLIIWTKLCPKDNLNADKDNKNPAIIFRDCYCEIKLNAPHPTAGAQTPYPHEQIVSRPVPHLTTSPPRHPAPHFIFISIFQIFWFISHASGASRPPPSRRLHTVPITGGHSEHFYRGLGYQRHRQNLAKYDKHSKHKINILP